jgi:hypothetical protein
MVRFGFSGCWIEIQASFGGEGSNVLVVNKSNFDEYNEPIEGIQDVGEATVGGVT